LSFSLDGTKLDEKRSCDGIYGRYLRHSAHESATPLRFGCRAIREVEAKSPRGPYGPVGGGIYVDGDVEGGWKSLFST
jgi:hypothetical protein